MHFILSRNSGKSLRNTQDFNKDATKNKIKSKYTNEENPRFNWTHLLQNFLKTKNNDTIYMKLASS